MHLCGNGQSRHIVLFEETLDMPLRQAFANALKFARVRQGLSQLQICGSMDASYVSRLEAAQSSVTVEASDELAQGLKLHPISLLSLVYAAEQNLTPSEVLERVSDELSSLELFNAHVAAEKIVHPRTAKGSKTTRDVLRLKRKGMNQSEVARELEISTSTVGRHWNRSEG
jgi:transcriptional regulator with XRE-family HTH domain